MGNSIIRSFSIDNADIPILDDVFALAKMEGISFSRLVVRLLSEYRIIHQFGNPQTRVDTWVLDPNTKAYPVVGQNIQIYLDYASKQDKKSLSNLEGSLLLYLKAVRQYL